MTSPSRISRARIIEQLRLASRKGYRSALMLARPRRDLAVVMFVDNVDQLAPDYQAQVFLLAERLTRLIGCVTIVSLLAAAGLTTTFEEVALAKLPLVKLTFIVSATA